MYVITGATGKTGRPIAENLLAAGKQVRVIARREERLTELAAKGAVMLVGDLSDEQFLMRAFKGATAVYAMIPPDYHSADYRAHQLKIGAAITVALKKCGVPYVVTLSSLGAHLPEGTGIVQGLYEFEQMINRVEGLHALHLRPTSFMENLFGQIGMIRQAGFLGSPVRGNLPMPMVAAKDVAAVGAARLLALDFEGKNVQYVLGPRDVTYEEISGIIGTAIGKPDLKYVQIPYDQAVDGMTRDGSFSLDTATRLVEFARACNDGAVTATHPRSAGNTTPTTMEEFAKGLAAAMR